MFNRTKEIEIMSDAVHTVILNEHGFDLFPEVAIDVATNLVDAMIAVGLEAPVKGVGDMLQMNEISDTAYYGSKCFGQSEDISTYKRGSVTAIENLKRTPIAFFFLVINPKEGTVEFAPFSNTKGEMTLPSQITVSGKNHPAMINVVNLESVDMAEVSATDKTPFVDMVTAASVLDGDKTRIAVLFKAIEVTKTRRIDHKKWFGTESIFKELDHYFYIQPIIINKRKPAVKNDSEPDIFIIDSHTGMITANKPVENIPDSVLQVANQTAMRQNGNPLSEDAPSVYGIDSRTGKARKKRKPIAIKPTALAMKREGIEKWFRRMRETHLDDLNDDLFNEIMGEVRTIISNDVTATNVTNIRFKSGNIDSFEPLEYRDSYKEPYKILTTFYKIQHSDGYRIDYVPQTVDVPDDKDTLRKLMKDEYDFNIPVMYTALRIHTLTVGDNKYFNEVTLEWLFIADDVEDEIFVEKPLLEV